VIGAGAGGLAAAMALSGTFETTVLERSDRPGGKMRAETVGGLPVDNGPTVFTMKWAFEEAFAAAGASFPGPLRIAPLDVLARHGWRDGARLDLFAERTATAEAIGDFAGPDEARRYLAFSEDARRIYETLRDPFLRAEAPSPFGLAGAASPADLLRLDGFSTLWAALGKKFSDPRLRQLYGRYATYCGCSPFAAPATLMLIAHVEEAGVWAVDGGMPALARAMAGAAEANGAAFRYGAHVEEILVEGGRAAGVRLEGGERIDADIVVFNGDLDALQAGLLGEKPKRRAPSGIGTERSQSAITWAMAAETEGFPLSTHTVLFSDDYEAEFDAVFGRGAPPDEPTLYLFAPDRTPGAPDPQGEERLFMLMNAPAGADLTNKEIDRCETNAFSEFEAHGLRITSRETVRTTPKDFAARFPASAGALYGRAGHGWASAFRRAGAKTRLPGLYLAGGSVHPGPGVPMATLSGKAAAARAIRDFAST